MNIQQYKYVLAVAEAKHFVTAAEQCFVSQSTLSTMIGKLEDEIGVKIFDRKTKPVSITEEGRAIIDQLRVIVKEIDALENKIQELKGELVGSLKIGIIPTIAPFLLPLFLSAFAEKFAGVKISVQEMATADIRRALKNRSLDIGVAAVPLEDTELEEMALYHEPFLVFDCAAAKPSKRPVKLEQIDASKLLLLEEGHCLRTQVEQICKLSNRHTDSSRNFEFRAGSLDSLIRFTKAHRGITLLPHLATLDLAAEDQQRLQNFSAPVPVRSVGLVVHQHFVKQRLLETLRETIQAVVRPKLRRIAEQQVIRPV